MEAIDPNFLCGPLEAYISKNPISLCTPSILCLLKNNIANSYDDLSMFSHTTFGTPHKSLYLDQ
jgi:hypothetical protein